MGFPMASHGDSRSSLGDAPLHPAENSGARFAEPRVSPWQGAATPGSERHRVRTGKYGQVVMENGH